jgi:hypothetical protein
MNNEKLQVLAEALDLPARCQKCGRAGELHNTCCIDGDFEYHFYGYDWLETAEGAAAVRAALGAQFEITLYHDFIIPRVSVDLFSPHHHDTNKHGGGYLCNEVGYNAEIEIARDDERPWAEITATLNAAFQALEKGWLS